jgi:hypothetical protein
VRFKIKKREKAQVKVAVKVPPVKGNYKISGVLEVRLESMEPTLLPITSNAEVPEIQCIKELIKADEGCRVIRIPAKKNQVRLPPVPFKNVSTFNFSVEVEAISNENFSERAYDVITQNFVNCQASTPFFVNMQLKENLNFRGPIPTRDTIRKILVLKIKNSSVYYNFPI